MEFVGKQLEVEKKIILCEASQTLKDKILCFLLYVDVSMYQITTIQITTEVRFPVKDQGGVENLPRKGK